MFSFCLWHLFGILVLQLSISSLIDISKTSVWVWDDLISLAASSWHFICIHLSLGKTKANQPRLITFLWAFSANCSYHFIIKSVVFEIKILQGGLISHIVRVNKKVYWALCLAGFIYVSRVSLISLNCHVMWRICWFISPIFILCILLPFFCGKIFPPSYSCSELLDHIFLPWYGHGLFFLLPTKYTSVG